MPALRVDTAEVVVSDMRTELARELLCEPCLESEAGPAVELELRYHGRYIATPGYNDPPRGCPPLAPRKRTNAAHGW